MVFSTYSPYHFGFVTYQMLSHTWLAAIVLDIVSVTGAPNKVIFHRHKREYKPAVNQLFKRTRMIMLLPYLSLE